MTKEIKPDLITGLAYLSPPYNSPIDCIHHHLSKLNNGKGIGVKTPAYLATVTEYLAEVLELAANAAMTTNKL